MNDADRKLGGSGVIDAYYHQTGIFTAKSLQHLLLRNVSKHCPVSGSFCRPDVIGVYIDDNRGNPCTPDSPDKLPGPSSHIRQ